MPFSCACRQHELFCNGVVSYIHKISNKKIKADILYYMRTNDLLPRNASAVCQLCIDYVKTTYLNSSPSKRKNTNKVDDIIDDVFNTFDIEELSQISEAIGKKISSAIEVDSVNCSTTYKDTETLSSLKVSEWLNERNKVLVKFVQSAAGTGNNPKKDICIATAVDSVYKARRLTHIAPLQFCKNLVTYYLSGSKVLSQLNNRQTACGSYSTLQRWLKANAQQPLINDSEHDQLTFFDNNQVIARNWRVTFGHKTTASVITMVLHIKPSLNSLIQQNVHLSPRQWLYQDVNTTTINRIKQVIKEGEGKFDTIRNGYLANRLQEVRSSADNVQERLDGFIGPRQKQNYVDPYAWVPSGHLHEKPELKVGEPALYNPCSYVSVKKVLEHIQHQCGVGKRRAWTCVGCDGLPYVLGSRLIQQNDHLRDILLLPGHGHLEMTAVKATFKLLWDVCLEDIAKMLGFRTPCALMCCKACTNHHKSWMILSIYFYATMDEILKKHISADPSPSVAGLYDYIGNCKDKNFRFLCDVTLNYVLAIFVFRCGVRRNNTEYILAGKAKFLKLFYGLNHTFYQEIMYRDLKTRVLAPEAVHHLLSKTESFSVSGHASKGEGGDFVLESYNRRAKRWLPPGIPERHHWINVCRNLNLLEKIRGNTFKEMCITEEMPSVYQRDFTTEIFEWRVKLRSSYFSNVNQHANEHTSVSGEKLDVELVAFEKTCTTNLNEYLHGIEQGLLPGKGISLNPVFSTPLDRSKFHAIEKKTKQQISGIIEEAITDIHNHGDTDEAFVLDGQWQKIRGKTKKEMLVFYKEVVVALENATAVETDEEDEDIDDDE